MSEGLFSASWYRVATLQPQLRGHTQIHRHHYRGQRWYVLQDHATQRYHRFSPAAYHILGLMDGRHTVQEIWERACTQLGDDAPTQDEIIRLLTQLHTADVLQCNVPPDTTELLLRYDRQRRRTWQSQLLSPLFWRFPLFDPERFLQRYLPLVRPMFGCIGVALWLTVVGSAVVLGAVYWQDLTADLIDRLLTPQNVLLLWLVFPVVKTLHEFGHAFATKTYGGEVHEMGIMLLALMPMPYVDASAASAFRSKWQRIMVGAAGMYVELFLASLALFCWLNVEPGTVRVVAYNIMFIAGVSTVLFNGNPLLRYDGYYIFTDLLELPNLRMRAQAYVVYLCERYLFGRRNAESGATTTGERVWFVSYAIASSVYRLFVLVAITLFIASRFFFVGVLIAVGGIIFGVSVPLTKFLTYVGTSPRLRRVRWRAVLVTALVVGGLVGVVGWVPVPFRTRATGVIWVPEQAIVRAGIDGIIERVVVSPGTPVQPGDVLIVCRDAALNTRLAVLEARLQELQTRHTVQWLEKPAQAVMLKEEMLLLAEQLAHARARHAELTIRSRTAGTFVVVQPQDLPERFVRQGTQLAYVLDLTTLTARVVVAQAEIDFVRQHTRAVQVRLAERLAEPLPAVVRREVPAATEELPSLTFTPQGGGDIAVDPMQARGTKAINKLFQFDLDMPAYVGVVNVGGRVYVRFDHGWEPLGQRWYRQVRRLFLSKFHV